MGGGDRGKMPFPRVSSRIFAITFGYGLAALDRGHVERGEAPHEAARELLRSARPQIERQATGGGGEEGNGEGGCASCPNCARDVSA
jgi:hypothetical protein